ELAAEPEGRANVARQRPDVGAARTVDVNVHVDEFVVTADGQHIEPVDAYIAGRQFDRVALTDQLVGALSADLDGADRRRDLGDLAAQRGDRITDLIVGDIAGRNRLQDFAFGVFGRGGLPQADGCRIRLV